MEWLKLKTEPYIIEKEHFYDGLFFLNEDLKKLKISTDKKIVLVKEIIFLYNIGKCFFSDKETYSEINQSFYFDIDLLNYMCIRINKKIHVIWPHGLDLNYFNRRVDQIIRTEQKMITDLIEKVWVKKKNKTAQVIDCPVNYDWKYIHSKERLKSEAALFGGLNDIVSGQKFLNPQDIDEQSKNGQ